MHAMNAVPLNITSADTGLLAWLKQASPGDSLEYHRGFLALDRSVRTHAISDDDRRALCRLASLALRLSDRGLINLVQRRIRLDSFSYIAVARKRDCDLSQFLNAKRQP